jgi:hypothetical protein
MREAVFVTRKMHTDRVYDLGGFFEGTDVGRSAKVLDSVGEVVERLEDRVFHRILDPVSGEVLRDTQLPPDALNLFEELWSATVEMRKKIWNEIMSGPKRTSGGMRATLMRDPGYHASGAELIANMAGLMAFDPKLARKVAPRASKAVAQIVKEANPKVAAAFTPRTKRLSDLMSDLWTKTPVEKIHYQRFVPKVGKKQLRQFSAEGGFSGMGVLHNGSWWEWVRVRNNKLTIRNQLTGRNKQVGMEDVQRPVYPKMLERVKGLREEVRKISQDVPEMMQVNILTEDGPRLAINILDSSRLRVAPSLTEWVNANREQIYTPQFREALAGAQPGDRVRIRYERYAEVMRELDTDGVMFRDPRTNTAEVFLANKNALSETGIVQTEAMGLTVDGYIGSSQQSFALLPISFESLARAQLKSAGVPERELEYFMDTMGEELWNSMVKMLSPDDRKSLAQALNVTSEITENTSNMASRVGLQWDELNNRVLTREGDVVAKVGNESGARAYLSRVGPEDAMDLAGDGPIPSGVAPSTPGSTPRPPRPQEILQSVDLEVEGAKGLDRFISAVNFMLPWMTARESLAKSMEKLGLGPAYSKIYTPLERAIRLVDDELAQVKRAGLFGKHETFGDALTDVQKRVFKIKAAHGFTKTQRREQVVDYLEYATKGEIADVGGHFPHRKMSARELESSQILQRTGLADDAPKLLADIRLAKRRLEGIGTFRQAVRQMEDGGFPARERYAGLMDAASRYSSEVEIWKAMGRTDEEIRVMRDILSRNDPDAHSIAAVLRHAQADELEAGFRNGKAQFATRNQLSKDQIKVAEDIQNLYKIAGEASGIDAERHIMGYFPHYRKMVGSGVPFDDTYLKAGEFQPFFDWVNQRTRMGEIDVYNKDPLLATAKYLRGMFMKDHLDPVLPGVDDALQQLKMVDERAHRLMRDYVDQVQGRPHVSFRKINQVIQAGANMVGREVPPRLAEDVTNLLTTLAYGATIPFRPALIARNWFQVVQTVPARVGWKNFIGGSRMPCQMRDLGRPGELVLFPLISHLSMLQQKCLGCRTFHSLARCRTWWIWDSAGTRLLMTGVGRLRIMLRRDGSTLMRVTW